MDTEQVKAQYEAAKPILSSLQHPNWYFAQKGKTMLDYAEYFLHKNGTENWDDKNFLHALSSVTNNNHINRTPENTLNWQQEKEAFGKFYTHTVQSSYSDDSYYENIPNTDEYRELARRLHRGNYGWQVWLPEKSEAEGGPKTFDLQHLYAIGD